jgi:iron(III) transport system permease protein
VIRGLKSTASLMLIVPTITVFLSLAISGWCCARGEGPQHVRLLRLPAACVPSICFSVAAWLLALFVLADVLPIYGTIWILVLVYVVQRISYCTRMTNTAMIQVHKELEESATIFGAPTAGVMRRVLLPLLLPAMMYAWIWMALLTYRELTLPVSCPPPHPAAFGRRLGLVYGRISAMHQWLLAVALMVPILVY